MIKTFSIAGHPEEIIERIRQLESEGLSGLNFIPTLKQQYRSIEDFARNVMDKL